ncbi:MAG: hypothetical protein R3F04_02890 [Lysobacteraceae bacterium]
MHSQEEVQRLLFPLHPMMTRIVKGAWDDWRDMAPRIGGRFARTSANVVYERMIHRAIPEFDSMPGMFIMNGHQTVQFIFKNSVLFRFKKGDEHGLSRNYPTQRALAYNDQNCDLFGGPGISRVDVVYQLDQWASRITEIAVVARHDCNVLWSYSILEADGTSADVISITPKAPTPVESLVRPKVKKQPPEQEKTRGENS